MESEGFKALSQATMEEFGKVDYHAVGGALPLVAELKEVFISPSFSFFFLLLLFVIFGRSAVMTSRWLVTVWLTSTTGMTRFDLILIPSHSLPNTSSRNLGVFVFS